MIKYILLATTMSIAAPALAQEKPMTNSPDAAQPAAAAPATPVQDQTATPQPESQPAPAAATAQTAPAPDAAPPEGQPAQPATAAAQPTPADPAAQPAQPAAATAAAEPAKQAPATSATQVADVVTKEFGSYDTNGDGKLDQTEFSTWMTALRKASEPSFDGSTPAAGKWVSQAFAQADTDKSKSVSQDELTKFLTPKTAS